MGNVWGIGVTGGLAFASFYAVIVFINNNSEASDIYGLDIKIKRPPKIDPGFLMNSDGQKYAEIWFPIAYFGFNIISTLCLRFPLIIWFEKILYTDDRLLLNNLEQESLSQQNESSE